jgi:general secretion pathway protein G
VTGGSVTGLEMDASDNGLPLNGRWLRYFYTGILYASTAVVTLCAVIGVTSVPNPFWWPMRRSKDANVAAARSQVATFEAALELYARDRGAYPTTTQGLSALLRAPGLGINALDPQPYLDAPSLPCDPWGNDYVYYSSLRGDGYSLVSYGEDGIPGGSERAADVVASVSARVRRRSTDEQ